MCVDVCVCMCSCMCVRVSDLLLFFFPGHCIPGVVDPHSTMYLRNSRHQPD